MNLRSLVDIPLAWVRVHRWLSAGAVLLALLLGWWAWSAFAPKAVVAPVVGQVTRATIIATVSGSGQVSAENEIVLSPASGGTIVSLPVIAGQSVSKGQLIAETDPGTSGLEAENAKLSYNQSVAGSANDEADAEEAARVALSSAASDMTSILNSLDALYVPGAFLNSSILGRGTTGSALRKDAETKYNAAFHDTKAFRSGTQSGNSDDASLATAVTLAEEVVDAAAAAQNAVIYLRDREPDRARIADTAYTSATEALSDANSVLNSLTSSKQDLSDLRSGGTTLTLNSAALSLSQKQQAYADHFVYAPFDGVIGKVSAKVGDTAGSSGVATIVTKDELVSITLNEVDVAKVKVGQKATVSFDAIDGLTLAGTVASVEGIGTVSSGVVSYGITIDLDTQDDRVKPGMTANADIQTDVAQNVLSVPSSAVHVADGESYVLVLPSADANAETALQVTVTMGITDGTNVEVTSGVTEGQTIVVRQASATVKSTAASATSRTTGFGAAGGAVRTTGSGNLPR